MTTDTPALMTLKRAADVLRVHWRTALRYTDAGILTPVPIDGIDDRGAGRGPAIVIVRADEVQALRDRFPVMPRQGKILEAMRSD